MSTTDTCCTIVPYFKVQEGKLSQFKTLCERFVQQTENERDCIYYGFSFNDNQVYCREGYKNAEALLLHITNVAPLIEEALKISEITRLEIHGIENELIKLREPLSHLNPIFFTLEFGFRQ